MALILSVMIIISAMPIVALATYDHMDNEYPSVEALADEAAGIYNKVELDNVANEGEYTTNVVISADSDDNYFIAGYGIQADEPMIYMGIEALSSPSQTPPPVSIPNRRLTPAELDEWIANYHARGGIHEFEQEVVRLVNIERAAYGLHPFTLSPILMLSARFKTQSMVNLGYFAHESPVYGDFWRISRELFNATISGENLARWHMTPQAVVDGWMASPGHRNNILHPVFTEIGVGFFNFYWAQKFSASHTVSIPVPSPAPTVSSVSVTPQTASVNRGERLDFVASVVGTNFPSQGVTWSVEGQTDRWATLISADGQLTVSMLETAAELTIRATSIVDGSVSGVATVAVGDSVVVNSWTELRRAVNLSQPYVETTILIGSSFDITMFHGGEIGIPANRHITLASTNTSPGYDNVRTMTKATLGRHFLVGNNGSLTLCQNVTLDTVSWSGAGVGVMPGGKLIMNAGSALVGMHASLNLNPWGTASDDQAVFIMRGGTIRGSASANYNSKIIMEDGSVIYGRVTIGTRSVLEMHGTATIRDSGARATPAVLVTPGGAFTMYGGSVTNTLSAAPQVEVRGGTFIMYDGRITEGARSGVEVTNGTFVMNGGMIENNTTEGVRMLSGTMYMSDGSISNNVTGITLSTTAMNARNASATMTGGTISNNGEGVRVNRSALFSMSGGSIMGNGRGVVITLDGVFNMTSNNARIIENNNPGNGGGIALYSGTVHITAGIIAGNTAQRGGAIMTSVGPHTLFSMTGGYIINNTATYDGGGIFEAHTTPWGHDPTLLYQRHFNNIDIGPNVVFSGNTAGNGPSAPPLNYYARPNIASRHASIWGHPINNYDINFTGRLGQEHGITSWEALRAAVNAAPANTPTTIYILSSFEAPTVAAGSAITIPSNRQIILISSNPAPGTANTRELTQANTHQHHFIVQGSLTLGRNITLRKGTAAGGVQAAGGTFTMGDGSNIIGW